MRVVYSCITVSRFKTELYLACPEPLKEMEQGTEDEMDTDGPNLVTSRSGHIIAVSSPASHL